MHAEERQHLILSEVGRTGFITYRDLEARLTASPATIRRDLTRLERSGQIVRVHGGAKTIEASKSSEQLKGTPFAQSISERLAEKQAIGRAAAELCSPGEGVMMDGGTTTLQMCPHLAGLGLQVLTNSLHIVDALLPQPETRVLVPSGSVFREQNIILAPGGEDSMPRFHAPKLFMGAAAVGPQGVMQQDIILVAAERRFIERAESVILLVDSSKFSSTSGAIVCELDEIDVLVTDAGAPKETLKMLHAKGIEVIVAN